MGTETASDITGERAVAMSAWRASVLNVILTTLAIVALLPLGFVLFQATRAPEQWPATGIFAACYLLVLGLAIFRRLNVRLRAWGLLSVGYLAGALALARVGLAGDGRVYLMALPPMALILVGVRSGLATTALSIVIYVVFTLLASQGWMKDWLIQPDNPLSLEAWADAGANVLMMLLPLVLVLWQFIRFQEKTLEAARQTTAELVRSSDMLRKQTRQQEEANRLLAEQAQALTTAAEMAHQITSLTHEQDLIDRFATLISERLNLYHCAIFLPDAQKEHVVLSATSSEEGRRMLQRGHQVLIGSADPVGQAAQGRQSPLSAIPVTPLPDLPQSRWRVSLPLQGANEILGVLDIHSSHEQPPSEEHVRVIRILAEQLAVGLQNARLFAQTQASLEELTQLYRTTTREAWQRFVEAKPSLDRYQAGEIQVSEKTWHSLFGQVRQQGQTVSLPSTDETDGKQRVLAVPITLRGVPIGVLGFQRPEQSQDWRPEEITLAERVAERTAVAMENVRLLEESRRHAAQEQLINETVAKIRSSITVDAILKRTAEELGRTFGATHTSIRLETPEAPQAGQEPA